MKSPIREHKEIIDGEEVTYYTQASGRYIYGTKDMRHFNCLICKKNVIGEDDRCINYRPHDTSYGICYNFKPEKEGE
jgi:hypothetical protein